MNNIRLAYASLLALGGVLAPAPGSLQAQSPGAAGVADSTVARRDSLVAVVRRAIAGKENQPAESVFKDIQTFRGVPAGRLPIIMSIGFSRSLGVSCEHCHDTADWASSAKPQKQIARDMSRMAGTITRELLPAIKGLKSAQPVVNCTTCHRGSVKPALDLPLPR